MRTDSEGHITSVLIVLDRHRQDGSRAPISDSRRPAIVYLRGSEGETLYSWPAIGVDSTYEWVTGVLSERARSEFTAGDRTVVVGSNEKQCVLAVYEERLQNELTLCALFTIDPDLALTVVEGEQTSTTMPPR